MRREKQSHRLRLSPAPSQKETGVACQKLCRRDLFTRIGEKPVEKRGEWRWMVGEELIAFFE